VQQTDELDPTALIKYFGAHRMENFVWKWKYPIAIHALKLLANAV
jgi:hypothetical protein